MLSSVSYILRERPLASKKKPYTGDVSLSNLDAGKIFDTNEPLRLKGRDLPRDWDSPVICYERAVRLSSMGELLHQPRCQNSWLHINSSVTLSLTTRLIADQYFSDKVSKLIDAQCFREQDDQTP
jgi:hypothetical protein